MSDEILGFCETCTRVRWLAWVDYEDSLGNPHGVCRSCAREEGAVEFLEMGEGGEVTLARQISMDSIRACRHLILSPEHYRENGTCRCNDPYHSVMKERGYTWDVDRKEWR